jgi:hypothetical protein
MVFAKALPFAVMNQSYFSVLEDFSSSPVENGKYGEIRNRADDLTKPGQFLLERDRVTSEFLETLS